MANGKQDEIDRELNAALTKYAAEPRTGLEERVLANLHTERARVPAGTRWHWSLTAAATAIVIVALTLALRSGRTPHPAVANHPSSTTPGPALSPAQIVSNPPPSRRVKPRRSHPAVATAGPAERSEEH